jgi:hypothetical protein
MTSKLQKYNKILNRVIGYGVGVIAAAICSIILFAIFSAMIVNTEKAAEAFVIVVTVFIFGGVLAYAVIKPAPIILTVMKTILAIIVTSMALYMGIGVVSGFISTITTGAP